MGYKARGEWHGDARHVAQRLKVRWTMRRRGGFKPAGPKICNITTVGCVCSTSARTESQQLVLNGYSFKTQIIQKCWWCRTRPARPVRTSGRTCSWHRQINVVIGSCGLTHNILLSKMGFVVLYDFTYVSGILNKVFWPLVLVPLGSTVCGSGGQRHTQFFNLEDLFRISVSLEGKADMLMFDEEGWRFFLLRSELTSHPVILSPSWVQHLGAGSTAETWELQEERHSLKLKDDICKNSQRGDESMMLQQTDCLSVRAVTFLLTTAALL